MSDRYFLDTNIFVYSLDSSDARKAQIAERMVTRAATTGQGIISYQVAQEFLNVGLRDFRGTMTVAELERYFLRILLPMMMVSSSASLFLEGLHLQRLHQLSWYDALIVVAALQGGCKILYTEDMQHGRRFGDLVVQNPFL
jgi:predicted nucleic acid-binding protein